MTEEKKRPNITERDPRVKPEGNCKENKAEYDKEEAEGNRRKKPEHDKKKPR